MGNLGEIIKKPNFAGKKIMGKGDRKTRRGKIFAGTYGKYRPRKKKKKQKTEATPTETTSTETASQS